MSEPAVPDDGDQDFARRARAVFAASAQRLDAGRLARLAEARRAALAEHGQPRFRVPGLWLPVGALAAAATLAIAVFMTNPVQHTTLVADASPVEDAELLTSNDALDMYAEDPEFYEWAGSDEAKTAAPDVPGAG
jgi:hypothetical protein